MELIYRATEDPHQLLQELENLVQAEKGCCGAAGVKFELIPQEDGARIQILATQEGPPSQTVISAFAAMKEQ